MTKTKVAARGHAPSTLIDRSDYLATVKNLDNLQVNVSSSMRNETQVCLLQVEQYVPPGFEKYTCAYLSDQQIGDLIEGLVGYLLARKDQ